MRFLVVFCSLFLLISCSQESTKTLSNDFYRVTLEVQNNEQLPFVMQVIHPKLIEIYNADEIIEVDEIEYRNDSVFIQPPVFEGIIAAKITNQGFHGVFIKESLDRIVPLVGLKGVNSRFEINKDSLPVNLAGTWEVDFSGGSDEDEYKGKATFQQHGNLLTGTFRTSTGDYRYLEGIVDGKQFKLSVFDGAHAFLFTGNWNKDSLKGIYYSDKHWNKNFTAKRNPSYELPNSEGLTFLKEGFKGFDFSFPDLNGNMVSYSDKQFKDKVTVVQIMGSWCPNCLDESKFLTQYIKRKGYKDISFVALAFEQAKTQEKAINRIKRLKERIQIPYPILLAQYGGSDKNAANEKLPMLNHILSYPTTIFIDKFGKVRKIHTGFNGPATGQKYLDFQVQFESFIETLRAEASNK